MSIPHTSYCNFFSLSMIRYYHVNFIVRHFMKIYDFRCEDCKNNFEVFITCDEDYWTVCPKCKSTNIVRVYGYADFKMK